MHSSPHRQKSQGFFCSIIASFSKNVVNVRLNLIDFRKETSQWNQDLTQKPSVIEIKIKKEFLKCEIDYIRWNITCPVYFFIFCIFVTFSQHHVKINPQNHCNPRKSKDCRCQKSDQTVSYPYPRHKAGKKKIKKICYQHAGYSPQDEIQYYFRTIS